MSEENDNGPVIRYLTNARFKATRDHDPEKAAATDQQKPANMPGVFVMVGLLVAGVAGVMVIGPEKTANAARNLMSSRKAPAENVAKEGDP